VYLTKILVSGEKESFGPKAFVYRQVDDFDSDSESESGEEQNQWKGLKIEVAHPEDDGDESSESEDEMMGRDSPLQDDTNRESKYHNTISSMLVLFVFVVFLVQWICFIEGNFLISCIY
jgi:hypothetical protein